MLTPVWPDNAHVEHLFRKLSTIWLYSIRLWKSNCQRVIYNLFNLLGFLRSTNLHLFMIFLCFFIFLIKSLFIMLHDYILQAQK